MKRNYKILLTIVSATLFAFKINQRLILNDKDKLLLELLTFVLEKVFHYNHTF
jgi:hypothetical protein